MPGEYRLRLKRIGRESLSSPFIVAAAACDAPAQGVCVERSHCDALGADWSSTTGECGGFSPRIVCCANLRQSAAVSRDANAQLQTTTTTTTTTTAPSTTSTAATPASAQADGGNNVNGDSAPVFVSTEAPKPFLETTAGVLCCIVCFYFWEVFVETKRKFDLTLVYFKSCVYSGYAAMGGLGALVLICCCLFCCCLGCTAKRNKRDQYVASNSLYHMSTKTYDSECEQSLLFNFRFFVLFICICFFLFCFVLFYLLF